MIPSSCKIGGKIYTTHFSSPENDSILHENSSAHAYVDHNELRIVIRCDLPEDCKNEAFLHEVLHALFDDSGTKDIFEKYFDSKFIENFVTILAPRLHSFLKNNEISFFCPL